MVDLLRPLVFALVVLVAAWPASPIPSLGPRPLAGRGLATLTLLAIALATAAATAPVPIGLIAYAGFFPLLRGLRQILSAGFRPPPPAPESTDASIGAVFRQTTAGGMDALAVLIPVFATHTATEILTVAAGVLLASPALARVRGPRLASLRPAALAVIGVYLLIEGGAFTWMWRG
jgi:cadmium resistance protein CadD (predicted permease)